MRTLLPPLCLFLALLCLIGGIALLATGEPGVEMELHQARIAGNQAHQQTLEEKLDHRRWMRRVVIGGLFASGVLLGATAFLLMKPSR